MSELRDFVASRLAAIEPRITELEAQLVPLRAEMIELKRVRAILDGKTARGSRQPGGQGLDTIQEQALTVLREVGRPLPASEIGARIEVRFGRKISRESLAPQLSRLRQAGRLDHVGLEYALPSAQAKGASHADAGRRSAGEGNG